MIQKSLQKRHEQLEFGDFQTPKNLTDIIVQLISNHENSFQSIIEPSCGVGNFVLSALNHLEKINKILCADINQKYLECLEQRLESIKLNFEIQLINQNFFDINWFDLVQKLPEPILILGNPPWATNSKLSQLESFNLPIKTNFQNKKGFDAITGKSNFDISEWMILKYLEWLQNKNGMIATLCKTSVARKILIQAWSQKINIQESKIYSISALEYFGASVDACLLLLNFSKDNLSNGLNKCFVFQDLMAEKHTNVIGLQDDFLIFDLYEFENLKFLNKIEENYHWRSGIKHDCSKIMELEQKQNIYYNGYNFPLDLENYYIYPLLKSSDLNNNRTQQNRKCILVTQQYSKQDTSSIKTNAPKTWDYLQKNIQIFLNRKSSIYKNSPSFSIFGVGHYSFAPWKIAISGFYKSLDFKLIGSIQNKPVIFDDTIYFLPCYSEKEAIFLYEILNSCLAQKYLKTMIYWNDKRPITINLLKRLNLHILAKKLDREDEYLSLCRSQRAGD